MSKPKSTNKTAYRIRVGYVTPFVVQTVDDNSVIAAFHSLHVAMDHFPTAEVEPSAWRKAAELGEK